jgi:uncharacterized membrane protein
MNFLENPLFFMPLIIGSLLLVIFSIVKKFPPKKINSLYGYRTGRSMKSQEAWEFAQSYSTELMLRYSFIYLLTFVLEFVTNWLNEGVAFVLSLLIMIAALTLPIIHTERELRQRFSN